MESNLSWMFMLVRYSRFLGKSLKREYFRAIGAQVELYRGVTDWFTRTTAYAAQRGIELEHYIISSGLKEIIEAAPSRRISNAFMPPPTSTPRTA